MVLDAVVLAIGERIDVELDTVVRDGDGVGRIAMVLGVGGQDGAERIAAVLGVGGRGDVERIAAVQDVGGRDGAERIAAIQDVGGQDGAERINVVQDIIVRIVEDNNKNHFNIRTEGRIRIFFPSCFIPIF